MMIQSATRPQYNESQVDGFMGYNKQYYAPPLMSLTADATQARDAIFCAYQTLSTKPLSFECQQKALHLIQDITEKSILIDHQQSHKDIRSLCENMPTSFMNDQKGVYKAEKQLIRGLETIQQTLDVEEMYFLQTPEQKLNYVLKEVHHYADPQDIKTIRDLLEACHQKSGGKISVISDIDERLISQKKVLQIVVAYRGADDMTIETQQEHKHMIVDKELKSLCRSLREDILIPLEKQDNTAADPISRPSDELFTILHDRARVVSPNNSYKTEVESLRSHLLGTFSLYGHDQDFLNALTLMVQSHHPTRHFPEMLHTIKSLLDALQTEAHEKRFNYGTLDDDQYDGWCIDQEKQKEGSEARVQLMIRIYDKKKKMEKVAEELQIARTQQKTKTIKTLEVRYQQLKGKHERLKESLANT